MNVVDSREDPTQGRGRSRPTTNGLKEIDMQATPISDYLSSLDSHTIYDHAIACHELRAAGYTGALPVGSTFAEMARQIEDRRLGGSLEKESYPGQRLIGGYQLTNAIVASLALSVPGFFGRGSQHRANLGAIAEWEKAA